MRQMTDHGFVVNILSINAAVRYVAVSRQWNFEGICPQPAMKRHSQTQAI